MQMSAMIFEFFFPFYLFIKIAVGTHFNINTRHVIIILNIFIFITARAIREILN